MARPISFYGSSIGQKIISALTGLFLCAFLIVHLCGNLLLFRSDGGRAFDEHARANASSGLIRSLEVVLFAGFISVKTGGAPDANAIPISKPASEAAFEAAACIGCGACVAACKNASAMLFVSAKVAHPGRLPQGAVERRERALAMVAQMDAEGFGACSNTYACEYECPKQISVENIAYLNREFLRAKIF
jgi:ferredoxin